MTRALRLALASRWLWLALFAAGVALAGWRAHEAVTAGSSAAAPTRWGLDPTQPSGVQDPLPVLEALPAGYTLEAVLSGLDRPVQLAALPDGALLIAQRGGDVRVVRDGALDPAPLVSVDAYRPAGAPDELGLTGIAVDPDWDAHPYVYLYYTTERVRRTALARVRIDSGVAGRVEELRAWRARPHCCRSGGGLRFAPDGTLLVAVGDHEQPDAAQDPATTLGSVVRVDRNGRPAADNPFGAVYAYGLRDPSDVAVDPATGRIFAGENGAAGQDAIVEIAAGADYGWPGRGLRVPEEDVAPPWQLYQSGAGIAGLEFATSTRLSGFAGRLLYCQRGNGGALHALELKDDGSAGRERVIAPGCSSDLATGADGWLYFLNEERGALYRIGR